MIETENIEWIFSVFVFKNLPLIYSSLIEKLTSKEESMV